MGSLAFGGTVVHKEDGDTFHGDHGYAQYFVPWNATNYPIILWRGLGVAGTCFESAPDGREGFWQMFQRANVPVYILDQPRKGRASYTMSVANKEKDWISCEYSEAAMWENYRYGTWRLPAGKTWNPGSQAPRDPYALEQVFRKQIPNAGVENTSPEIIDFMTDSVGKLLQQAGESILFTYSYSGKYGWYTAGKFPQYVKGIVAYEPGQFVFPDDIDFGPIESPVPAIREDMKQYYCPREQWMNLTKFPIRVYFGDYIKKEPSDVYGDEIWRISVDFGKKFEQLINENGGDCKVMQLPEAGIYGNGHTAFAEANNEEVFELFLKDMKEAGLLANDRPYQGPQRMLTETDLS